MSGWTNPYVSRLVVGIVHVAPVPICVHVTTPDGYRITSASGVVWPGLPRFLEARKLAGAALERQNGIRFEEVFPGAEPPANKQTPASCGAAIMVYDAQKVVGAIAIIGIPDARADLALRGIVVFAGLDVGSDL